MERISVRYRREYFVEQAKHVWMEMGFLFSWEFKLESRNILPTEL